jgi:biotin carboxyl carrier protein
MEQCMSESLRWRDRMYELQATLGPDGSAAVTVNGVVFELAQVEAAGGRINFELQGRHYSFLAQAGPEGVAVAGGNGVHRFSYAAVEAPPEGAGLAPNDHAVGSNGHSAASNGHNGQGAAPGGLASQMPGKVLALLVEPGAQIEAGTPLLILEAMKMEHEICAPTDGVVRAFPKAAGERVMPGDLLAEFVPAP